MKLSKSVKQGLLLDYKKVTATFVRRWRRRRHEIFDFGAKFVECMNGLIFVQIFSAAKYIQLSDIGRQGGVGVCVGGKKVKLNISNNILK